MEEVEGYKIEFTYKGGKLNGTYKIYYDSGKVESTWEYADGKLEGTSKIYYKNGKASKIQPYKNHKLHGWYITYNEKGKVTEKWLYDEGKIKKKVINEDTGKKNTIKSKDRNMEQGR